MFASIETRSVAPTCVLLGGSGKSRSPTVKRRLLAALLRSLPSRQGRRRAADVSRFGGR